MPLIMKCAFCSKEVEGDTEYFNIHLSVRDEDHRENSMEDEYEDFCEECIRTKNVAEWLLVKLNARNPPNEPKRKDKE